MGTPIKQLTIEGFKSIKKLENFELRKLNILIGANGAGKSNFVELFRLLRAMADENLQNYIEEAGGGEGFFFQGPKITSEIKISLTFGLNGYRFSLKLVPPGPRVSIVDEATRFKEHSWWTIGSANRESQLKSNRKERGVHGGKGVGYYVYDSVSNWTVYHFHDTSRLSPTRLEHSIEDNAYLRANAENIASFLHTMREENEEHFTLIQDTVKTIAPFFGEFLLKKRKRGDEIKVALDWEQKGSDFPFQPSQLSDGTLRFICLATALLQPSPPPTIVIDEPELGLHPHALEVLAGLLQKAATRAQVIVSTQSAPLLSQFEPEDVITVTRQDGASTFGRLDKTSLADWLKDYTLGELWQKNVVEAGAGND